MFYGNFLLIVIEYIFQNSFILSPYFISKPVDGTKKRCDIVAFSLWCLKMPWIV